MTEKLKEGVMPEQRYILGKRRNKYSRKRELKDTLIGWLFSGWPLLGYILFSIIPFILSVVLSFSELHSFDLSERIFVGYHNFRWIFTEKMFWQALGNTLYFSLKVPLNICLSLFCAVLLTKGMKGTKTYRTILYIPNVCSVVAVTMMWRMIFHKDYGVVNTILGYFGVSSVDFFGTKSLFMPTVIFTTLWGAGAGSIMFQAALEQVNVSLKEAAMLDGASSRQIFFRIILPVISPTTFYVLVTQLIGAFQVFDVVQMFADGGPGPENAAVTSVYMIYRMYKVEMLRYGLGMASACAWMLALIIAGITIAIFKTSKYWVFYDD